MSTEFINLENAHVYSKSPVSPGGLTTQAVNKSVHTIQSNEVWAEEIPFIPTFNSETIAEQIEGHPVSVHTNKLTLLTSANNNGIGANGYAARVFIDGKPVEQYISETDKISEDGKLSNGYKPVVFLENGDLMPSSDYIVNCSSGIVYFFKEVTSNNYSLRYFTYDGKKLSDINSSLNDSFEEITANIEKNTTKINKVEEDLQTANTEIDDIHSDIEEINSAVENIDSRINSINNEIIDNKIIINDIIISDDVTTPALQIEATKSEETPSPTTYTFTTNIYNKEEVDNKIAEVENTFTVADSIDTDLTTPVGITSNGSRDYTLTYNTYTTSEVDTKLQNKVDEIGINEDETVISIELDESSNNKKYIISSDTYNKSVIDEKIELGKTTIKIADEINTNIETPIGISSAVTDSGSTEYTIDYNTYNTSEIDSKVNSKVGDIIVDDECPTLTITSETVDNNKIYTINSNAYTSETVDSKIAETKNEIIDIINDKVIVVERASDDNSANDVLTVTNTSNEGSSDIYTIRVNAYNKAQTEEKINASLAGINSIIGERSEEEFRPSNNPDNTIWQTIDNLHDKFNDRLAGLLGSTVSNIAGDSFIDINKDVDTNTHEISLRTASSIDFEQNPGTTVPTTAAVKAAIDAVRNNAGSGDGNPVISTINLVGDSFVNANKNEYGDTWQVSLNVSSNITSEENPQTTIPTVEATKNIIESTKENINNSINSVEQTFSENLANHASSDTHLNSTERTKWDSYEETISGINDSINDHTTNNNIHISAEDRTKLDSYNTAINKITNDISKINDDFSTINSNISTLTTDINNHEADTTIHYQKFNTITETESATVSSKAIYDALKAVKVEEGPITYEPVWDKINSGSEKANAGGFYFTLDEDISCNTIEIYNIVKGSDTEFEEAHIKIWDKNSRSLVASSIEKTTLSGASSDIWILPTTELMANTVYIVTFNDNNISTSLEAGYKVRFELLANADNKPAGCGLVTESNPMEILYNHVAPKVVFKNKVQEITTTTIIPNSLYGEFLDHTENKDIHVSSEDKAKWDAASTNGNTALAAAAKNQGLIFSLDEDVKSVKQDITSLTTTVGSLSDQTAVLENNYRELFNTVNRYHPQTAEAGSISEDTVLSADNESIILNDTVNAIFNLNDNDNIAIVSYTPHITGDIDLSTAISNNQIIFTLSKKETTINGEHYLVLELLYIDKNLKQVKRVYSYITIIVE